MEQIVIGVIIGTICSLVGSVLGIKKAYKDIEKEEKARTEKNTQYKNCWEMKNNEK